MGSSQAESDQGPEVLQVLILGSGGREHALYWKISQSPRAGTVHVAPGNGGIPANDCVQIADSSPAGVAAFVQSARYDLVVVGPEQPLVDGVVDALEGICPAFGPVAAAARLEGSKSFAKDFMERHGIPTARAERFTSSEPAIAYVRSQGAPIVIKADGLAAGKGVTVATDLGMAEQAIRECLDDGRFGDSGASLLVEEYMPGTEASVFAICDGDRALAMLPAQDHKRAFDGDQGPNTGGMGAFAPSAVADKQVQAIIQATVLDRALAGMRADGTPYRGLLYAGLMIGPAGEVRVVEFNVRFGDPETQALLRLLDEDLLDLLVGAASGNLPDRPLRMLPGAASVVVVAAEGYPGDYAKGLVIKGLDNLQGDIICFHAGTRREDNTIVSSGGRILGITATAETTRTAAEQVYTALKKVEAPGTFYRTDIGASPS